VAGYGLLDVASQRCVADSAAFECLPFREGDSIACNDEITCLYAWVGRASGLYPH
jgi:hypothetical protein